MCIIRCTPTLSTPINPFQTVPPTIRHNTLLLPRNSMLLWLWGRHFPCHVADLPRLLLLWFSCNSMPYLCCWSVSLHVTFNKLIARPSDPHYFIHSCYLYYEWKLHDARVAHYHNNIVSILFPGFMLLSNLINCSKNTSFPKSHRISDLLMSHCSTT